MKLTATLFLILSICINGYSQQKWDYKIQQNLPAILKKHRALVSIPNIATNKKDMFRNIDWVTTAFKKLDFNVSLLETTTLPVFLAEKTVNKDAKTVLFYLHLDGQAVNPKKWQQEDPFVPVLKEQDASGNWKRINWKNIDGKINPDWRVFGRAAADDKAPIIMLLSALEILKNEHKNPNFNIKIILDLQEEAGSKGFLSSLETYKNRYQADYFIIMDGPAHTSNKPTLTFGCRGIATCSIQLYGAKLPQHSGHYGNFAPNPIFALSHLLASMKDKTGKVTIDGFYDGIQITPKINTILKNVPDNNEKIKADLSIVAPDAVGNNYQESLQYPSLNVRHIETSWKGAGLKTIIPEIVTAHIDVRLVKETDGAAQLEKIKKHIVKQGYLVLDRAPTDAERLTHPKIATFLSKSGVNAFRTPINSKIGTQLKKTIKKAFGETPILIRTMGGTVPIIPAVNTLKIPAIIVPMVNMDNNQHNPNENIRIGNISKGIKICLAILSMEI